jgi:hypothetical protein
MSLDMVLMDEEVNLFPISLYISYFFATLWFDVFYFAEKCYSLCDLGEYD